MGNFDSLSREKNQWFNYLTAYDNEHTLYDLMLTEAYNLHGVCSTYYVVSYDKNNNRIWGEDNNRRFERKFDFMSFLELPKEEDNSNKFGIGLLDSITVWISKRHFEQASKYDSNGEDQTNSSYIPKAGDILSIDYSNFYYEIAEVSQEEEMFLQKKHSWELTIIPFKNEHNDFVTSANMPDLFSIVENQDVFNIADSINDYKMPIIFSAGSCEEPKNNDKYGWW